MKHRKRAWGLGLTLVAVVVASACTPTDRALGDEPISGAGGDGSNAAGSNIKAGSGTVLPNGGGKTMNPPTDAGSDAGGAPTEPQPCFSPAGNFELAREHGLGCPCNATDPVCVAEPYEGTRWYGMLECSGGRWKSVPSTCEEPCFSPTSSPMLAVDAPDAGCSCSNEPEQCVRTTYQGRAWDVGLTCLDGRWQSVEDGVCGDGRQVACRVDGVTYPDGATGVPNPYSACNTCDCRYGELVNCSTRECADTNCDEGSSRARRCVQCGPTDACLEIETGCFAGEDCESGFCAEGRCG